MPSADEEFLAKLNAAFAIEAAEHVQALSSGLIELESPGAEGKREKIETIFREAHSLKGAARSVSRPDIESVCQAMESVFSSWKKGAPPGPRAVFDVLGRAVDFLDRALAAAAAADPAQMQGEAAAMVQQLRGIGGRAAQPSAAAAGAPPPQSRAESREPQRIFSENAPPTATPPPAPAPAPAAEDAHTFSSGKTAAMPETVRIATAKMDALLLQAEEMLAAKTTAAERAAELRAITAMTAAWQREWRLAEADLRALRTVEQADGGRKNTAGRVMDFLEWNHSCFHSLEQRLAALAKDMEADRRALGLMVDGLLADAKQLVLLPFSTVLDAFPRQVRDLAREQGKEVELVLRGREVEIDKRILEEIKDPLIHLVRNAIDHGIEAPQARAAAGKPARARLTIAVSQLDARSVEITVRDDGAGIDAEQVKAAAVKSGALSAEEAARRSGPDALALIFLSGVSTSASVTRISGRGIGMAIVREKAEKVGGRVAAETQPGGGTTFRITLPVEVSTFRGLRVAAAGREFIVPLTDLERVVRIPRAEIRSVENRAAIEWHGSLLALARLDDILGIPRRAADADAPCVQALILRSGEKRIAFAIDDTALDEHEILVKPLARPLVRVRNIAAAAVLGSGKTVLVLRVPDLFQSAATLGGAPLSAAPGARGTSGTPPQQPAPRTQTILVADDSVTSRMLLKNILESAGYSVRTAIDGAEALAALHAQPFDLVVSDVEMPRMDGFDLTARIRADKRLAALPVVLVTALESREHRERGIDVGANAYIVKSSFDQSNLLETVRRMI